MAATDTAFDHEQFESIYPDGVERHYWNQCRNRVILSMLDRIRAEGPMIEVGCGKGLVVEALRAAGHDVVGVDIAEVTPKPGLDSWVRTGTDAFALPVVERKKYRTLLLLDVIEHIEHPADFIERLRLDFTGLEWIVYTVPARQELFSAHDTFNNHFRRYDLGSLRTHVDSSGKRRFLASYFFHSLYPLAWLQARLSANRRKFSAPEPGLPSLFHKLVGGLFFLEHLLGPSKCPGTSIIAAVQEGQKSLNGGTAARS